MDGLWATKSEGVRLSVRAISFHDFRPMWSWSTNVTDGQTDRRTTCDRNTALCTKVHCAVRTHYCVISVLALFTELMIWQWWHPLLSSPLVRSIRPCLLLSLDKKSSFLAANSVSAVKLVTGELSAPNAVGEFCFWLADLQYISVKNGVWNLHTGMIHRFSYCSISVSLLPGYKD